METASEIFHDTKGLRFIIEIFGEFAHVDYRDFRGELIFIRIFVPEGVRG